MNKNKYFAVFAILAIAVSACMGPAAGNQPLSQEEVNADQPAPQDVSVSNVSNQQSAPQTNSSTTVNSNAPHTSDVDLTHLELGDGKYSTSPQLGYVYSCMTSFNGGGAQGTGDWINGDGTWDATKKAVVDGSVLWPSSFNITIQGDQRVFTGNDLPDHTTGTFPISSSDDAYAIDRNPNSIQEQSISFSIPANPTAAAQPNCVGGEVGIMLSGSLVFNAFDAEGRDAVAHEVQDECDGHPQAGGFYHYHSLSDCIEDTSSGHSSLVGYAFDGYGIYGYYGEDGSEVTNEDLDACHGHTHVVEWEGQMVEMYHYHATHEFPYTVSCFHGTASVRGVSVGEGGHQPGGQGAPQGQQGQPANGGQQPGQPNTGGQTQQLQPVIGGQSQQQGQQQGGSGQPPQQAIDACASSTVNATCSINTPNGTLSGTCQTIQNQLACVPAGGPQGP